MLFKEFEIWRVKKIMLENGKPFCFLLIYSQILPLLEIDAAAKYHDTALHWHKLALQLHPKVMAIQVECQHSKGGPKGTKMFVKNS